MDKSRIERFYHNNEDKNAVFPEYVTLDKIDYNIVLVNLQQKFHLKANDNYMIAEELFNKTKRLENVNPEEEKFSIIEVLRENKIAFQDTIYFWSEAFEIEKMKITDFDRHFSNIWYPAADDIGIFDSTYKWYCEIFHESEVRLVKAEKS